MFKTIGIFMNIFNTRAICLNTTGIFMYIFDNRAICLKTIWIFIQLSNMLAYWLIGLLCPIMELSWKILNLSLFRKILLFRVF